MDAIGWPGEPGAVRTVRIDVADGDATLPLVCRFPAGGQAKGSVVFCHGLGGNGEDHVELSAFLAGHGYLVIHPTFADGAAAVAAAAHELGFAPDAPEVSRWILVPALRDRLFEVLHTPFYWLDRIRIVTAVMDNLPSIKAETIGASAGSLPTAIAGHSFGAYASQLLSGAEIDVPGECARSFHDRRFAAAVLLSPQGRGQQGLREGSWDAIEGPMLTVTGTRDGGAKGQDWRWKTEPFHHAPAGDKYLAVLDEADHFLGGMTRNDPTPGNPAQREAVSMLTLAFLDACLVNDRQARAWLTALEDHVAGWPAQISRK
ncbi:alpha/beta hydrolase family protein [Martelella soudanensis]|uniref:alpha/beta hydrolase family protein n=1 Tax=unclassified Martelella TaxID=2629616 RepID=UPI0015DDB9F1|nr:MULTISPECIES: hypothetical protein [unclassified Martelella]